MEQFLFGSSQQRKFERKAMRCLVDHSRNVVVRRSIPPWGGLTFPELSRSRWKKGEDQGFNSEYKSSGKKRFKRGGFHLKNDQKNLLNGEG